MTHDQLMQALSPVRLPTPMAILSTAEMAALLALGIIAGLVLALAVLPFTRRRAARPRLRVAALRGLPVPRYWHHELLVGADGERLAKRHGAPTLAALREAGVDGAAVAARLRAGAV